MLKIRRMVLYLVVMVFKLIYYYKNKKGIVLCAPPSSINNKGDEALTISAFQEMNSKCISEVFYAVQTGNVSIGAFCQMFNIIPVTSYFQAFNTYSSFFEQVQLYHFLSTKKTVIIIGADLLDSGYSTERTEMVLRVALASRRLGLRVFVNSFSMKDAPSNRLKKIWRKISKNGSSFYTRDSESQKRMLSAGFQATQLSSDLAFLLQEETIDNEITEFVKKSKLMNKIVIGLNLNYVSTNAYPGGAEAFRALFIKTLHLLYEKMPLVFLLIPSHSPDDILFMEPIWKAILETDPYCGMFVNPIPKATQVKSLLKECDHVFTGRLHIAIMALGICTPVTCFPYQGKFEGQLEHFDLRNSILNLSNLKNSECDLLRILMDRIQLSSVLKQKIEESLPKVKMLAQRNFSFLNDSEST